MAKQKRLTYLSELTTEPSYVRLMIRHAATTGIEYTHLNTNSRAWLKHTDALAEVLLAATIDYLSKAKEE